MIHQLRIYEIFERNKAAFHARFRDHCIRIMRRYGFEIVEMWESSHSDGVPLPAALAGRGDEGARVGRVPRRQGVEGDQAPHESGARRSRRRDRGSNARAGRSRLAIERFPPQSTDR